MTESRPGDGVDQTAEDVQELPLRGMLEAILLVVEHPVTTTQLADATGAAESEVLAEVRDIAREFEGRRSGIALREVGGGWRFYTAPEYTDVVAGFLLEGQSARLSQAALETLAVVAYQQPVSRARIAAVRGVNVDGVVRTLVLRGLVEEEGTDEATGALLYRTTPLLLEKLGLNSLTELPPLGPLVPELETLDGHDSST